MEYKVILLPKDFFNIKELNTEKEKYNFYQMGHDYQYSNIIDEIYSGDFFNIKELNTKKEKYILEKTYWINFNFQYSKYMSSVELDRFNKIENIKLKVRKEKIQSEFFIEIDKYYEKSSARELEEIMEIRESLNGVKNQRKEIIEKIKVSLNKNSDKVIEIYKEIMSDFLISN